MSAEPVGYADPILNHTGPWTEESFLALPQDEGQRVELIDGGLIVTPHGDVGHQNIEFRLVRELDAQLPEQIVGVHEVNVRLRHGAIVIPDIVVTRDLSEPLVLDVRDVLLVGEIVSSSAPSKRRDRVEKPALYAEAGVHWYLRVEREPDLELILYELDGDQYRQHQHARSGEVLKLPHDVAIDVDILRRRR
jgi:Uma2 family endonuclease